MSIISSARPEKRRRIVPLAVQDDELPVTMLPAPTVVLGTDAVQTSPADPGRRFWADISQGYEVNYVKHFKAAGGKSGRAIVTAQPDELRMPGEARSGRQPTSSYAKALERIEKMARGLQNPQLDEEDSDASDQDGPEADDKSAEAVAEGDGGSGDEGPGEGTTGEAETTAGVERETAYDLLDDWIDDSEHVMMIQTRDTRKMKHAGFFVNSGFIERVGEKAVEKEDKAAVRKKKVPKDAADGDKKIPKLKKDGTVKKSSTKKGSGPLSAEPVNPTATTTPRTAMDSKNQTNAGTAPDDSAAPVPVVNDKDDAAVDADEDDIDLDEDDDEDDEDDDDEDMYKDSEDAGDPSKLTIAQAALAAGALAANAGMSTPPRDPQTREALVPMPAKPALDKDESSDSEFLDVRPRMSEGRTRPPTPLLATSAPQSDACILQSAPPGVAPIGAPVTRTSIAGKPAASPAAAWQLPGAQGMHTQLKETSADIAAAKLLASVWGTENKANPSDKPVSVSKVPVAPPVAASTPQEDAMAAHTAKMMAVSIAVPSDVAATLPTWTFSPLVIEKLQALQIIAAQTPPPSSSNTKRKLPSALQKGLESLVRPFYINADVAANANKAKAAMWRILVQLLFPWSVESTIKTKMQQYNAKIMGEYGIAKDKFLGVARVASDTTNATEKTVDLAIDALGGYVDALCAYHGVSMTDTVATEPIWSTVQDDWRKESPQTFEIPVIQASYAKYAERKLAKATIS